MINVVWWKGSCLCEHIYWSSGQELTSLSMFTHSEPRPDQKRNVWEIHQWDKWPCSKLQATTSSHKDAFGVSLRINLPCPHSPRFSIAAEATRFPVSSADVTPSLEFIGRRFDYEKSDWVIFQPHKYIAFWSSFNLVWETGDIVSMWIWFFIF